MNSWLRLTSLRLPRSRRVWWKSLVSKLQNSKANTKTKRRRTSSHRPKAAAAATWLHKLLFLKKKKKKKPPQRRLTRRHVSTVSASSSAVHAHADVVTLASPSWGIDARAEAFIAKFRADMELQEMVARGL